ncbi:integrin alpha-PS2-like isoform X2 [Homarus americanus]|uniref:integrin alpha-PS2-like isoform X2 n=1 Tax=Homarus americanus TaxID=6706 RepID=UPI001C44CF59|nr:integrin alpha-PS2-like isoform X2 [Homarus americanus]
MEEPRFEFLVVANSTNGEDLRSRDDNIAFKTVLVDVDTKLTLYGSSAPENIEYNRTLYRSEGLTHEHHLGPEVMHKYGISNNGPSEILETELVILWPTKTLNDNYLLYLLEQPHVTGPIKCTHVPSVNPLNLVLTEKEMNVELLKLRGEKKEVRGSQTRESYSGGVTSSGEGAVTATGGGGGGEGSLYYEESSGSTYYSTDGGNSSHSSSSSSSSSSTSYTHSSSSSSSSSSSGRKRYSSSSDSSSYSSGENDLAKRDKRQADGPINWDTESTDCGPTKCTRIHCVVGPLVENDIFYIYVRSRLMVSTLAEYPYEDISITSRMVARVKSLPHGVNPEYLAVQAHDVMTPVSPAKSLDVAPQVPWWVIVLATLAGILILLIIILILWKCGYFKRHRPEQQARNGEDAQPLNPTRPNNHNGVNGHNNNPYNRPYYPGDEAL